jgi:hypothetical protein
VGLPDENAKSLSDSYKRGRGLVARQGVLHVCQELVMGDEIYKPHLSTPHSIAVSTTFNICMHNIARA